MTSANDGIDRSNNAAQAARPPGRADAPLSARLSLLLEPARARRPRGASSTPRPGRACSARRPRSACCRCICPAASRRAARPRGHHRRRPCRRPLHQSHHLGASASPTRRSASSPRPGSITCRSPSRTAKRHPPTISPAMTAPSRESARSQREVVRLEIAAHRQRCHAPRQYRPDRRHGRAGIGTRRKRASRSRTCSITAGR